MPLSDKSIEIYYIYFVRATMRAKQALIVIVYLLGELFPFRMLKLLA